MSLFDDDSFSSSSSSGGLRGGEGSCRDNDQELTVSLPMGACGKNGIPASAMPIKNGGVSRFTLTAEENKQAEERRRMQAGSRSMLRSEVAAASSSGGVGSGQEPSRFQASIAEALQLRKDAREVVLLRRIQKQRREEASNSELVEKDLEVGVFVTPQYMAALKRQNNRQCATLSKAPSVIEDGGDAADPLEAYVRQLEEKRSAVAVHSSSTATDVLHDDCSNNDDTGLRTHMARKVPCDSSRCGAASEETQHVGTQAEPSTLIPMPITPVPYADNCKVEHVDNRTGQSVSLPAAPHNAARLDEVIHEARESRKRRRADRLFMETAAKRFNERALERVEAR
ncbi:hypothetical protein DQ04_00121020 [Trypanosoma grayi]|uniref:hypothetical protein n=1 Tax=Trypanosoma grayi TaxID=71804 RepID=UPI0004F4AE6A|nr:hypothetical protein DQ04_00121020 [Trypanosoma grayi]KEG15270.1 hypothetical protein DQ04_00121020 [Trypanosoma grayi]